MEQNLKKPITLKSLYSTFTHCVELQYLYVNYKRYGAPLDFLTGKAKHTLSIDNHSINEAGIIFLDHKYKWVIRKYG